MADNPFVGLDYETIEDAAEAAMWALRTQPRVSDQEYVTIIGRDPQSKKYRRTRFDTSGDRGNAPLSALLRAMVAANVTPEAITHNHPGTQESAFDPKYLSGADTSIGKGDFTLDDNIFAPMQMYLWAGSKDNTLDFRKGTGRMRTVVPRGSAKLDHRQPLQVTEPYLAQFPIDEFKMGIANRIRNSQMAPGIKARLLQRLVSGGSSMAANEELVPLRNNMNILAR